MKQFIYSIRLRLFAALAGGLAVFSGCQNTEEIASLSDPLANVTFAAQTNRSLSTRATETTAGDVTTFNVFGIWSEGFKPLDNLAPASVSGGNGAWTYDPKQYWPDLGTIDFFAYSPDAAAGVVANYSSDDYSDMSIGYTVPDIENQEDLLVAVKPGVSCTRPEVVTLTFHHALSRIQLKARPASSGTTYNVHGAAFINLSNSGTLELNSTDIPASDGFVYSDNAAGTPLVLWTGQNTAETDYVFDFDASPIEVVPGSDYSDIITGDESLLVLPQTTVLGDRFAIADEADAVDPIDGKFYVKIVYSSTDAPEDVMVKYFAVREPLNPALNKPLTFEIGRSYTFVVDLSGSDYVNFADVEVTGFDEAFGEDLPDTNINEDPDPAVLASYTPKAHKGFAGSNIYWDATNQRLTFDDVDVTTHKNYQGLYFKWGSLIGISPADAWGGSTVLYSPDGVNGMYVSITATDLVSGTWTGIVVGDATDFSTSSIDGVTDYRTNGYVSFLNATPANLIAYKGDICAYLSGRPGVPAGYWRLPVSAEFEPDTFPNPFTSPGQYTRELGGLDTWPSSAGTSNKTDGTFEVANGYTLAYGGSTVFFPASGSRNGSTGALSFLGVSGYAWSSSADAANGRYLNFSGTTVNPAFSNLRAAGLPARCVKK